MLRLLPSADTPRDGRLPALTRLGFGRRAFYREHTVEQLTQRPQRASSSCLSIEYVESYGNCGKLGVTSDISNPMDVCTGILANPHLKHAHVRDTV